MRSLIGELLHELARRGNPGAEQIGPYKKSRFGGESRPVGPMAFFVYLGQVDKGYVRGEPYRPMVQHYVGIDGQFYESSGEQDRHSDLAKTTLNLYERVEKLGLLLPIDDAILMHPGWSYRLGGGGNKGIDWRLDNAEKVPNPRPWRDTDDE